MGPSQVGLPPIPAEAKLNDRAFFADHKDRKLRIRLPIGNEYSVEFRQFGMHDETRRRIIVSRVPSVVARQYGIDFMRIPFLLFADETVEDTDKVLLPIWNEIMGDAAAGYGM